MDLNQQNVNLNYTTPVVVADGHAVLLNDQGVPTLLFFQARQQHDDHLHADVVAAVRLNNQEDLKNLAKAIDDTIKKHKNREP
jgi:lauroyl/myristoyl acyltransferase